MLLVGVTSFNALLEDGKGSGVWFAVELIGGAVEVRDEALTSMPDERAAAPALAESPPAELSCGA